MLAGRSPQALSLTWKTFSHRSHPCLGWRCGELHHLCLLLTEEKMLLLCAVGFGAIPRNPSGKLLLANPPHCQGNPATPSQNAAKAPARGTWAAPHLSRKSSVSSFSLLLLPACTGTNRAVTCHSSNLSAEIQNRQTLGFCSAATI